MPTIEFEYFTIEVDPAWGEIETSETYDGQQLAGPQWKGRLLFQVTPFDPDGPSFGEMSQEQLLDLLKTFGETRFWEPPTDVVTEPGPPRLAAGSFIMDQGQFARVWQVSH